MYCVGDHSDWTLKVFRRPDLTRIKYKDKLIKRNHTHNIRFHHLWILWYSMNWTNRVHESFLVWERKWYGREAKFQKPLMLLWNVYNLNDCNIKMNNLSIWKQARFIKLKWIWSEQIHKKKNGIPSPLGMCYTFTCMPLVMDYNYSCGRILKKIECKCTLRKFVCSMLVPPEVTCFIENKFRFAFY